MCPVFQDKYIKYVKHLLEEQNDLQDIHNFLKKENKFMLEIKRLPMGFEK